LWWLVLGLFVHLTKVYSSVDLKSGTKAYYYIYIILPSPTPATTRSIPLLYPTLLLHVYRQASSGSVDTLGRDFQRWPTCLPTSR